MQSHFSKKKTEQMITDLFNSKNTKIATAKHEIILGKMALQGLAWRCAVCVCSGLDSGSLASALRGGCHVAWPDFWTCGGPGGGLEFGTQSIQTESMKHQKS